MSHAPLDYPDELAKIQTWHVQKLAYLINRLKSTAEGGGSVFDSTLVLQGSEVSTGLHTRNDMPWLLAGNLGGKLRTGRFLEFPHLPHNNLLLSVVNAFGVPATSVGIPDLCTGPLPGLA